jgi:azurin
MKDGRVLIIGNKCGMSLLSDLAAGANETPYAEAMMASAEKGQVICVVQSEDPDKMEIDTHDPQIDAAVNEMVETYTIEFEHDIKAEFRLDAQTECEEKAK